MPPSSASHGMTTCPPSAPPSSCAAYVTTRVIPAATPALRQGFARLVRTMLRIAANTAPTHRPIATGTRAETMKTVRTASATWRPAATSATRSAVAPPSLPRGTNTPATPAARTAA